MTAIAVRIHVAPDHSISGAAPEAVPPGEHIALIQPEGLRAPARQLPTLPFDVDDLPVRDLGPWPEGMSLRREDMYGDDGR